MRRFVAVVGHEAERLMSTVSREHPDVLFTYQAERRGTGHAARCGVAALRRVADPDAVLIAMGDKLIHTSVAAKLLERFRASRPDLAFVVLPKDAGADLGRIVVDGGRVLGDVEAREIGAAWFWQGLEGLCQRRGAVPAAEVRTLLKGMLKAGRLPPREAYRLRNMLKGRRSIGVDELRRVASGQPTHIQLDGRSLRPEQAEADSPYVNAALYLFDRSALEDALDHVPRRGGKGEEYLTDGLNHLASARRPDGTLAYTVEPLLVEEPRLLLSFNTVAQLMRAREVFMAHWS